MCFCADASFAAAGGLAVVGIATVAWRSQPAERFMTATPLWFAGQQAIEGLLWLRLQEGSPDPVTVQHLTTAYLFFALFWWPGYTSFAAWWMEPVRWRRRVLAGMAVAGFSIGGFLYQSYLANPTPARIVHDSISHDMARPGVLLFTGLYIGVALAVGWVSSRRRVKLFYLLFAVATVVALLWYRQTFTSVWCFFAAVLSGLLWFNPRQPDPAGPGAPATASV